MLPTSFSGWIFVLLLLGWFVSWLFRLKQQWTKLRAAITSIERLRQVTPALHGYTSKLQEIRAKGTPLPNFPEASGFFESTMKQVTATQPLVEPLKEHLRTVFLAGTNESVLEAGELISSTKEELLRAPQRLAMELGAFVLLGLLATVWVLGNAGFSPVAVRVVERHSFAPAFWGLLASVIGGVVYARFREQASNRFSAALSRATVTEWIPSLYPTVGHKAARWALETFQHAAIVTDAARTIEYDTVMLRDTLRQAKEATAEFTRGVQAFQQFAQESERSLANTRFGLAEEIKKFATTLARWSEFEAEIRRYYSSTSASQHEMVSAGKKQEELLLLMRKQITTADERLVSLLDLHRVSIDQLIQPIRQIEHRLAGLGEPFQATASELTEIATNVLKLNRSGAAQVQNELAAMRASIEQLIPPGQRSRGAAAG